MKKMSVGLVMVVLLGGAVMVANLQGGLIAQYTFNNGSGAVAVDTSGNGKNGAIYGDAAYLDLGGGNHALYFDGAGDWVNYGNLLTANWVYNVTCEVWVKEITNAGGYMVFGQDKTPQYTGSYLAGINGGYRFYSYYGDVSTGIYTAPVVTNVWHHVVSTLGNGYNTLYMDGQLINQKAVAYYNNTVHKDWTSGFNQVDGKFLYGAIDEIRMYDTTMTAAEVSASYHAGPTIPEPCTIGLLMLGSLWAWRKRA